MAHLLLNLLRNGYHVNISSLLNFFAYSVYSYFQLFFENKISCQYFKFITSFAHSVYAFIVFRTEWFFNQSNIFTMAWMSMQVKFGLLKMH